MRKKSVILGIQFGGHDTAAGLMIDGKMIATCEEERYNREKHTRAFPNNAIKDCLKIGGVTMEDIDEIGFGFDPILLVRETYLRSALENDDRMRFFLADIDRIKEEMNTEERIRRETDFEGPITFHRHHLCHLASAYYPSGFQDALLYSIDGMGEIETTLLASGKKGAMKVVHDGNRYPHSLGLLYSAITFYLGWKHHCDEGIIMGLAPYGNAKAKIPGSKRTYADVFADIIKTTGEFDFEVNTEWIAYHKIRDTWVSDAFKKVFGPKREPSDPLEQHHKNIAAALQDRLEEIVLKQLRIARKKFKHSKLCLAGGVALNCSLNGAIESAGIFDEIYVQPASGDQGTVIGACYLSHLTRNGALKPIKDLDTQKGSRFTDKEIIAALKGAGIEAHKPKDIFALTAQKLSEGKIVGWFQGGAEFGPRALGNRSILTRPYPAAMKDHLNARVKFREEFRPFAPAVLPEFQDEYFSIKQASPHMLIACKVRPGKRSEIAATVHVDDSCRVQTVLPKVYPHFYKLLRAFEKQTKCPVLLNTSFNVKGQPIVNSPIEAIKCFQATNIDFLVVGDWCVEKAA